MRRITLLINTSLIFLTALLIMFSSNASAESLESFLNDKQYWDNFNWGKIYSSTYFKKLSWTKFSKEQLDNYNAEYSKNNEKYQKVVKMCTLNGMFAEVPFRASIEDKIDNDKVKTVMFVSPVEKEINKDDYYKVVKTLFNTYGNKYLKSINRYKLNPANVMSFETYEWVLKRSIIHLLAVVISDTEGKKPDSYMPTISILNKKSSKIMSPDIILSCEQTLISGSYKDTRTFSVVVKDEPEVQNMRTEDFFETKVKATVTDTSIYLNSDIFETRISRITGNITGKVINKNEKPDLGGESSKQNKFYITGKCVKISESNRAF